MISKEQALNIAKQLVPDLDNRGFRIAEKLNNSDLIKRLPENCWNISYSQVPLNNLSCSNGNKIFLCVNKENGTILFHNIV